MCNFITVLTLVSIVWIEAVYVFAVEYAVRTERLKRAVTSAPEKLWPNATVPYVMRASVADHTRYNILLAMSHWEQHTCIRFRKRRRYDKDFIHIGPGACGCCSFVGRRGGRQVVTLSEHCAVFGVVIHELGHVIGFWHEHSRPDRDDYIQIFHENIKDDRIKNFDVKSHTEIDSLGVPYDFDSVMHYRKDTFSKNAKQTVEPKAAGVLIGQRRRLSKGDVMQANLLYNCPRPDCGKVIYYDSGYIDSPNYPFSYYEHHNCTWIIHTFPGDTLELEILDIDIEEGRQCEHDYVEVRQGSDVTGQLIGRLCGRGQGGTFVTGGTLWVHFHSDSSVTGRGFRARYKTTENPVPALDDIGSGDVTSESGDGGDDMFIWPRHSYYRVACNKFMTSLNGSIESPLIPIGYAGPAVECAWTLQGDSNVSSIIVRASPKGVHRPAHAQCIGDVYRRKPKTYYDQDLFHKQNVFLPFKKDVKHKTIDTYMRVPYNCSESMEVTVATRALVIHWSSEKNMQLTLDFYIDYDECALGAHSCEYGCENTVLGSHCVCPRGHMLTSDGKQCKAKTLPVTDRCNSTLIGERGKLRASTEPVTDCYFRLRPPEGSRLVLTFTKFLVQSTVTQNVCLNYVEICSQSGTSKGVYCNENIPSIISSSHNLVIRSHSDISNVFGLPYFTAEYFVMKNSPAELCNHRISTPEIITNHGWPSTYYNSHFCAWRVSAPRDNVIHVVFTDLDIEYTSDCAFDFIELRDGRYKGSPLLGRFCGNQLPSNLTTTGNNLFVALVTDSTGSGRGFRMLLHNVAVTDTLESNS